MYWRNAVKRYVNNRVEQRRAYKAALNHERHTIQNPELLCNTLKKLCSKYSPVDEVALNASYVYIYSKNYFPHVFTQTDDSRPQKLTWARFCMESKIRDQNIEFLHLNQKSGKTTPAYFLFISYFSSCSDLKALCSLVVFFIFVCFFIIFICFFYIFLFFYIFSPM